MRPTRVIRHDAQLIPGHVAERWIALYEPIITQVLRHIPPRARNQVMYDEEDLRQVGRMAILEAVSKYQENRDQVGKTGASISTWVRSVIAWRMKEAVKTAFKSRSPIEIGGFSTTSATLETSRGEVSLQTSVGSELEGTDEGAHEFAEIAQYVQRTIHSFELSDRAMLADWLQDIDLATIAARAGQKPWYARQRIKAMLEQIRTVIEEERPVPIAPRSGYSEKAAEPPCPMPTVLAPAELAVEIRVVTV